MRLGIAASRRLCPFESVLPANDGARMETCALSRGNRCKSGCSFPPPWSSWCSWCWCSGAYPGLELCRSTTRAGGSGKPSSCLHSRRPHRAARTTTPIPSSHHEPPRLRNRPPPPQARRPRPLTRGQRRPARRPPPPRPPSTGGAVRLVVDPACGAGASLVSSHPVGVQECSQRGVFVHRNTPQVRLLPREYGAPPSNRASASSPGRATRPGRRREGRCPSARTQETPPSLRTRAPFPSSVHCGCATLVLRDLA